MIMINKKFLSNLTNVFKPNFYIFAMMFNHIMVYLIEKIDNINPYQL